MTDTPTELPPLVPLARLLEQRRQTPSAGGALVEFDVSEDWLQGRTAFGGLTSAFGVQAMRDAGAAQATTAAPLRALQTSFVGPLGVGRTSVDAIVLRAGKSVTQLQATLRQGEQIVAVMIGVFAADRASTMLPVRLLRPAATSAPEQLPARSYDAAAQPGFIRHFDMRWDHGPVPGSGDDGMSTRIHMRLVDGDGLDDEMRTVVFADTSPTPATGQFKQRPPASSVTWALELRPLRGAADPAGWWRADNESLVVAGGFVNHSARLWAPSGELAGLASQVVAIYG